MNQAIKPSSLSDAAPVTDLERLRQELAELNAEGSRLVGISTRLSAEASAEAALLAVLSGISAGETSAMQAWAADGCAGPAPAPLHREREAIIRKLATAKASATAARGAIEQTAELQRQNTAALARIVKQIDHAVLDAMMAECHEAAVMLQDVTDNNRRLTAVIFGLRVWCAQEAERLKFVARRDDDALPIYRRAEAIAAIPIKDALPSNAEVSAALDNWTRRAGELGYRS